MTDGNIIPFTFVKTNIHPTSIDVSNSTYIIYKNNKYDIQELINGYLLFNSLMEAGVDNWEHYSMAIENAKIQEDNDNDE